MLREIDNLPDVISVMGNLPVDGLQDCVILTANPHRAHKIVRPLMVRAPRTCISNPSPNRQTSRPSSSRAASRIPCRDCASGFSPSVVRKSVQRESMLPAICLMMTAMLFDSSSMVRKKSSSLSLRERSFAELLVFAKRSQRVFQIMLADIDWSFRLCGLRCIACGAGESIKPGASAPGVE